jgi:RND family efflux transporter MFP subunit
MEEAMTSRFSNVRGLLLRTALVAAMCTALLGAGCLKKEEPKKKEEAAVPAKIITLGKTADESMRSFPGKVKAAKEVELSFEVSGRIAELPIKEGLAVKKGRLLAKLDPSDFENRVRKQKAKMEDAKVNMERAERLFSSGAVSKAEYDRRKALFEMADAELKIEEKSLADSSLKAPFDGLVARRYVDKHQYVKAKQNILSLQDVSRLEIKIDVPEDLVAHVKEEGVKRIFARFETAPDEEFDVKVMEFGTRANVKTQTFPITLVMKAPESVRILPGMTATVTVVEKLSAGAAKDRFAVPESAVVTDEKGRPYVWVVDEASMKARKRNIKVGSLKGGSVTVVDGLKTGDMLVVAGANHVRENMKVRPLKDKRGGGN